MDELDAGLAAFQQEDFAEAEARLAEVLRVRPGDARALQARGLALLKLGRGGEAAASLGEAERLAPTGVVAFDRGVVEMAGEDYQAAFEAFERAIERGFDPTEAGVQAAACLASLGRFDDARARLEALLEARPGHPEGLYWLGFSLAGIREEPGRWDQAVACLRELLGDPEAAGPWLTGRGHLLLASLLDDRRDHYDEAVEHYQAGIELAPDEPIGHNNLGALLLAMGRPDEARPHLAQAMLRRPGSARTHQNMARLYYRSMEEATLRGDLASMVEQLPGDELAPAVSGLMVALVDEARRQAYRDYYERCHRLKNLLAVAGGRIKRLLKKADEDSGLRRGLEGLLRTQEDAYERLADDLRELKPGAGPGEVLDLVAGARSVARQVRQHAPEGVEVEVVAGRGGLPRLRGDREGLREALFNLVQNAVEAQAEGPGRVEIQVRALEAGRWLEVVVEDDGPGLPAGHAARVFEPGFTSKPRGNGLGLAQVRRVVEGAGGEVLAEDREPCGARFRVRLPVEPQAPVRGGLGLAARPVRLEGRDALEVDELTAVGGADPGLDP